MSPPLLSRSHPNPDSMSVASSAATAPSPVPSNLKRKASDTTLGSSSTNAPALRYRDREDPFVDAPRAPHAGMDVDPDPIREQLVDNTYIFIPATRIWPGRDNLHHMKTMIENGEYSNPMFSYRTNVPVLWGIRFND